MNKLFNAIVVAAGLSIPVLAIGADEAPVKNDAEQGVSAFKRPEAGTKRPPAPIQVTGGLSVADPAASAHESSAVKKARAANKGQPDSNNSSKKQPLIFNPKDERKAR